MTVDTRPPKRRKISYPATLADPNIPSGTRTVRSAAEHVAVSAGKLVECTNTLSLDDFRALHYHHQHHHDPSREQHSTCLTSKLVENSLEASLTSIEENPEILEACFRLVEQTSRDDYADSEVKWSAAKKRREMRLPDLRYLVLMRPRGSGAEEEHERVDERKARGIVGFISFMVTYEDGREVLYVYEVHLLPAYRGKGLGRGLMEAAERVARSVGVEKVMLTVFRRNEAAVGMYEKLGYEMDEYSPEPKKLRNGTVKESGYFILSKPLKMLAKNKRKDDDRT